MHFGKMQGAVEDLSLLSFFNLTCDSKKMKKLQPNEEILYSVYCKG